MEMDLKHIQSVLFLGHIYIWCNYYFLCINAIAGSYNIALNKPTQQGPRTHFRSRLAVDGNLNQQAQYCAHTAGPTNSGSWWSVNFQGYYYLSSIRILRRYDAESCCSGRMGNFSIKGRQGNQVIYNDGHPRYLYNKTEFNISVPISLGNISFSGINISTPASPYLTLCEVQVCLAQNCTVPILNNGTIMGRDELSASGVVPKGATLAYTCDAGFTPYIQVEITCETNGLRDKSNKPPLCSARSCGAIVHIPPILNGNWQSSAANTYDNCLHYLCAYTYNCKKGYNQNVANPITTTCNENGTWTNPEGTCKAIECPVQTTSEANYAIPNRPERYTYGAIFTAECLKGYELSSGNLNRTCLENGAWSGIEPMCTIVSCTIPDEDATLETQLRPASSTAVYGSVVGSVCIRGYKHVSGNLTRLCQADRSWSGTHPVCNVIQCSVPKTISNGRYVQTSQNGTEEKNLVDLNSMFDVNTTLNFKCDDGFVLSDQYSNHRVCLENETWSAVEPRCTGIPPLNNPESLSSGLAAVTAGFIGAGTVIIILLISAGTFVLLRRKRRKSNTESPYETTLSSTPTPYSTIDETIRTNPVSETKYISAANRDTTCYEEITDKSKVYENLQI